MWFTAKVTFGRDDRSNVVESVQKTHAAASTGAAELQATSIAISMQNRYRLLITGVAMVPIIAADALRAVAAAHRLKWGAPVCFAWRYNFGSRALQRRQQAGEWRSCHRRRDVEFTWASNRNNISIVAVAEGLHKIKVPCWLAQSNAADVPCIYQTGPISGTVDAYTM